MVGRVVISLVSIMLIVGVALGVVLAVRKNGNDNKAQSSSQVKAVTNFCASADYPDVCQKTLGDVKSDDPKAYIAKAILVAQDEVKKFYNNSDNLIVQAQNGTRTRYALEDCKEVMDLAIDALQNSLSDVEGAQLHTIDQHIANLRVWLSGVLAYQGSCVDGFDEGDSMKQTLDNDITYARQLTLNALAIVTELSNILSKFGLQFNVTSALPPRKLLSVEKDGYPSWFSAADRKLMAGPGPLPKPNAVVAQDGSGQFKTISAALAAAPKNSNVRHVIFVKAGIYKEYVTVDKNTKNILMIGEGQTRTIVTGDKSYGRGFSTQATATVAVLGGGFIAIDMGFHNTAGPQNHQAVALRVSADRTAFYRCSVDAFQDTLYNQAMRQFFRECSIKGTIDFIFGRAHVVIQNSEILVRRPMNNQFNTVTAQGMEFQKEVSGTVIQNCRIIPDAALFPDRFKIRTFLGRPWKKFATTVVMESELADFIQPEGWMKWDKESFENTCYYAEFNNRGPGADLARRVNWRGYKRIDRNIAMGFTADRYLQSPIDIWLPTTGIPFQGGLIY